MRGKGDVGLDDNESMAIDFDAIVTELDESGALDESGITRLLMLLHDALVDSGLNGDDPTTYRHILAGYTLIVNLAEDMAQEDIPADYAIEVAGRAAARALRDLTR